MTLDSLPDLDTSGLCLVKTLSTALTCWPYRNMALRDRATAVASKNFGFCVPHSRTALVNVKSRKSSAVMQCSAADEMGALSAIVAVIDRYAFWCSVRDHG